MNCTRCHDRRSRWSASLYDGVMAVLCQVCAADIVRMMLRGDVARVPMRPLKAMREVQDQ